LVSRIDPGKTESADYAEASINEEGLLANILGIRKFSQQNEETETILRKH
jgi:hypothetical protein